MKKYSKIATSIVAGCALLGVTTGGAILLNDDDRNIIINVETTPQEDPKDPETPTEGSGNNEDIPQDAPVEEIPTEGETEDEVPIEGKSEESEEKTSPKDTPSEEEDKEETSPENSIPNPQEEPQEEPQEDDSLQPSNTDYGYITVEVKIYNRHSGMYTKSDILNFEGEGSISVYNLYEKIKVEYPSRKEYSSPSKSLNTYLDYSEDSIVDLIVYFN